MRPDLPHVPAPATGECQRGVLVAGGTMADCHQGPVFHALPDGRVRVVWWAYDHQECSGDARLLFAVSPDLGRTWGEPLPWPADRTQGAPSHPHFLVLRGGARALLFMTHVTRDPIREIGPGRFGGSSAFKSRARIFLRTSGDGGQTFPGGSEFSWRTVTGGKELPGVGFYGCAQQMIQLASGRVVAPFYYLDPSRCDPASDHQHYSASFLLSDDEGRNWRRSQEITTDTPRGAMEPTVVETGPNRLLCLLRTRAGRLYETASNDAGESWASPRPSALVSPESMARMIRLRDGLLLLVWNATAPVGHPQHPRHPLSSAISRDGGLGWSSPRTIADEAGLNQLSNHGLLQLEDGRILLGFSRYRPGPPARSDLELVRFDEAWLEGAA